MKALRSHYSQGYRVYLNGQSLIRKHHFLNNNSVTITDRFVTDLYKSNWLTTEAYFFEVCSLYRIKSNIEAGESLRNCLLISSRFPFTLSLSKGRATELRQAQSERSQAMKIGKLFPDNSLIELIRLYF